jgi:hydrogenase maturation factor
MTDASAPRCAADEHCLTCGDTAVRLRVLEPDAGDGLARCADAHGASELVDLTLVAPIDPGDEVLVHAGVALVRCDDDRAVAP